MVQNPLLKWVSKLSFLTSALSSSAWAVFFKGVYRRIPWALSCSTYSNCAKTSCRPRFDHCSRWICMIYQKVSLIVMLEFGILTSPRTMVTLGAFPSSRPKFFPKFRSRAREHSVEELLLSSRWTLIESELSSLNFNSSVRAERSFAIGYLNVVIKLLCGNLGIFLTTRLTPTFGHEILFVCFSRRLWPKAKDAFLNRAFRLRSCAIQQILRPKSTSVAKNPSTRMHLMGQQLEQTILASRSHVNLSIMPLFGHNSVNRMLWNSRIG